MTAVTGRDSREEGRESVGRVTAKGNGLVWGLVRDRGLLLRLGERDLNVRDRGEGAIGLHVRQRREAQPGGEGDGVQGGGLALKVAKVNVIWLWITQ